MKIITFLIIFFILIISLVVYLTNQPEIKVLNINGHSIYCEIADTTEKRTTGLMFRDSLGVNNGMVFVYPSEDIRVFHMPNVKMPLSIAFADRNGVIVQLKEMIVDEKTTYSSEKEAMYAVEANKGWFSSHQIKVGDKIEGLNFSTNP